MTVDRIVDGDTIEVTGGPFTNERVRLIGYDTPEFDPPECYAQEATDELDRLLVERRVWLTFDAECIDPFDRTLAYGHIGYPQPGFVNWHMLRQGFATTLSIAPNNTFAADFTSAQDAAQAEGLGIWTACN